MESIGINNVFKKNEYNKMETLRKENEALRAHEYLLKTQLTIALKKIKKQQEYIIYLENASKNGK